MTDNEKLAFGADSTLVREKGVFDISALDIISKHNPPQRLALVHLVSDLITTSSAELAQAKAHRGQGDTKQALELLHTLRGAVGILGAKEFAAATVALEVAIRSGTPDVDSHFVIAQVELEKTLALANTWRQHVTSAV